MTRETKRFTTERQGSRLSPWPQRLKVTERIDSSVKNGITLLQDQSHLGKKEPVDLRVPHRPVSLCGRCDPLLGQGLGPGIRSLSPGTQRLCWKGFWPAPLGAAGKAWPQETARPGLRPAEPTEARMTQQLCFSPKRQV